VETNGQMDGGGCITCRINEAGNYKKTIWLELIPAKQQWSTPAK